ncbi:L-threonine 3-dehydrogenase [Seinonella peptonophila]|uniref:L-threonine 3-dehydrogenase n=1 Tax=Seinonella peptonophila TaxID=112248 RepID=A0A1M4T9K5_9BACL|nr:L-threonine 3-dehydrogenase [Seinonella peptonophila]
MSLVNGHMLALVKHEAKKGAELKEMPIPEISEEEVLIQVKTTSICGTDLHIYNWDQWAQNRVNTPYIFGHEFAGVVVKVGSRVEAVQVGDHVTAETHIVCGSCISCRRGHPHVCLQTKIIGIDLDGCFAQYIAIPAANIWKIGENIPFEFASIMEPMGNAVHTVLSTSVAGKVVAVVGCGPVGLLAVSVAKAAGASQIIALDVNKYRLHLAGKMGATYQIDSNKQDPLEAVIEWTAGRGADVVVEMSGNPQAIQQALAMVTPGGCLSMLGLPTQPVELDITNQLVFKGITVHGIVGRRMFTTWEQTTGLLEANAVDLSTLITHQFPLSEYESAFSLMNRGDCGKIVLYIDE